MPRHLRTAWVVHALHVNGSRAQLFPLASFRYRWLAKAYSWWWWFKHETDPITVMIVREQTVYFE